MVAGKPPKPGTVAITSTDTMGLDLAQAVADFIGTECEKAASLGMLEVGALKKPNINMSRAESSGQNVGTAMAPGKPPKPGMAAINSALKREVSPPKATVQSNVRTVGMAMAPMKPPKPGTATIASALNREVNLAEPMVPSNVRNMGMAMAPLKPPKPGTATIASALKREVNPHEVVVDFIGTKHDESASLGTHVAKSSKKLESATIPKKITPAAANTTPQCKIVNCPLLKAAKHESSRAKGKVEQLRLAALKLKAQGFKSMVMVNGSFVVLSGFVSGNSHIDTMNLVLFGVYIP